MSRPQPFRCFDTAFFVRLMVAGIATLGLAFWAKAYEPGSAARITVVALEAVGASAVILLCLDAVRRLDEMGQRIHLLAIAISFTLTAVLGTTLFLLGSAGVPVGEWYEWLWPFMALAWATGVVVINRRYS